MAETTKAKTKAKKESAQGRPPDPAPTRETDQEPAHDPALGSAGGRYGGRGDTDTADVWTLEQLEARLKLDSDPVVDRSDPLAVQFTIHRLFINHLKEVNAEFAAQMRTVQADAAQRIEAILEETGKVTAAHVRDCLQVLRDETLDSSLKQTLARVAQEASNASEVMSALVRLRNTAYLMAALCWGALLLNVVVLAGR